LRQLCDRDGTAIEAEKTQRRDADIGVEDHASVSRRKFAAEII